MLSTWRGSGVLLSASGWPGTRYWDALEAKRGVRPNRLTNHCMTERREAFPKLFIMNFRKDFDRARQGQFSNRYHTHS